MRPSNPAIAPSSGSEPVVPGSGELSGKPVGADQGQH